LKIFIFIWISNIGSVDARQIPKHIATSQRRLYNFNCWYRLFSLFGGRDTLHCNSTPPIIILQTSCIFTDTSVLRNISLLQ